MTAERLLPGNWLRTRDIVRADGDGYIEVVGRQDDRISCAGESIYPKEVENVLMEHLNVADAAVVPMADELKGEVPVAFVVEKKPGQSTPDELKQFFLQNGAAYMAPPRDHDRRRPAPHRRQKGGPHGPPGNDREKAPPEGAASCSPSRRR